MTDITLPNATMAEVQAEIKSRLDQAKLIEDKYPGAITNQEDFEQVKKLLGEVDQLVVTRNALLEKDARREKYVNIGQMVSEPVGRMAVEPNGGRGEWKSPGEQFIESRIYRELKQAGAFNSNLTPQQMSVHLKGISLLMAGRRARAESKALVYGGSAVGGAFIEGDRFPGFIDILQRELTVLDLIDRASTSSDTIEYVRETAFTNAAAATAEATATTGTTGTKPESTLTFATATSPVRTIAHWIPVTNKMLDDAPAIRSIINGRLLLGLDLALETQIISGDGTGENLTGILATAGVLIQGLGTDNVLDAFFKARTQIRVTGLARPNAIVMHPNDWQAVRLARENAASATYGGYLMGPPSAVGATTLWGMPVVESMGLTENTGLIGDFAMGATLFDREDAVVRTGTIGDQFIRNMQTLLAELRAGFVVWRPTAFARVTGI